MNKEILMVNFKRNIEIFRKRMEYMNTKTYQEFLEDCEKIGFHYTVESICELYPKYYDTILLANSIYETDGDRWENLARKELLNFDVVDHFIPLVIEDHFDVVEVGDLYFARDILYKLEEVKKDQYQPLVEKCIKILVNYSKRMKVNRIENILEDFDMNECLKYHIKKCHNRNKQFNELMKQLYECYDDVDQSIYKVK